jgi:predicted DNA-binding protein
MVLQSIIEKELDMGTASNTQHTISFKLSEQEDALIRQYAEFEGISVSKLIRRSTLEFIEDAADLKAAEEAWAEFESGDQKTISHAELMTGLSQ